MVLTLLGSEIKLAGDVDLQQFIAAAVAQHAYQGIVDFDETTAGRAEEQAFLNIVEQLAITPFGLASVRDVFQNVNGLQAFVGGSVNA